MGQAGGPRSQTDRQFLTSVHTHFPLNGLVDDFCHPSGVFRYLTGPGHI